MYFNTLWFYNHIYKHKYILIMSLLLPEESNFYENNPYMLQSYCWNIIIYSLHMVRLTELSLQNLTLMKLNQRVCERIGNV